MPIQRTETVPTEFDSVPTSASGSRKGKVSEFLTDGRVFKVLTTGLE